MIDRLLKGMVPVMLAGSIVYSFLYFNFLTIHRLPGHWSHHRESAPILSESQIDRENIYPKSFLHAINLRSRLSIIKYLSFCLESVCSVNFQTSPSPLFF